METATPHRTLIVANLTASTPFLLQEVKRIANERPTRFSLLIPNVNQGQGADWSVATATKLLGRAAGSNVDGHVGGQDVDPAAQRGRQRREQVTFEHLAADLGQVAPGTPNGRRVHIGRVDVGVGARIGMPARAGFTVTVAEAPGHSQTQRPGPAAQVEHHHRHVRLRRLPAEGDRLADQKLRPPPRHEHPGLDRDPQPAELGPAQDLLQRQPRDPLAHHRGQLGVRPRRRDQQLSLILGEHASRRAQRGHHGGIVGGGKRYGHRSTLRGRDDHDGLHQDGLQRDGCGAPVRLATFCFRFSLISLISPERCLRVGSWIADDS